MLHTSIHTKYDSKDKKARILNLDTRCVHEGILHDLTLHGVVTSFTVVTVLLSVLIIAITPSFINFIDA